MLALCSIFFHVCCCIHLRSWSPWQQHVCSVCARDNPLVFTLLFTQRHLLLWDPTGQKHKMQIVPTELPIIINPDRDLVAHELCWTAIKYLNQDCNTKSALWAWLGADWCGLSRCIVELHTGLKTNTFKSIKIQNDDQYWHYRMHRLLSQKEWQGQGLRWRGVVLLPLPLPTILHDHCFIILLFFT